MKKGFEFPHLGIHRNPYRIGAIVLKGVQVERPYLVAHFGQAEVLSPNLVKIRRIESGYPGFALNEPSFPHEEDINFSGEPIDRTVYIDRLEHILA